MPSTDTTAEAPEEAARDERREVLLERLREALGDDLLAHHLVPGRDLWVRVARPAWHRTAEVCRNRLELDYFCFLSAIDWLPSPYGKGEDDPTEPPPERDTQIRQGYAGGETRFQVFARYYSPAARIGVTVKADLPDDDLRVETLVGVFAGANWHEREAAEMFGITFEGHPNPRHLYLPGDFEGHPLRKDFPLLARMVKPWPGIVDVEPMPEGEEEGEGDGAEGGPE